MANPLFEEALEGYFASQQARKIHTIAAGFLAAIVLLSWPGAGSGDLVWIGRAPATYGIVAFTTVLVLLGLALVFAVDLARPSGAVSLEDWIRLSALSPLAIVWGRVGSMALHTLFLCALPLPMMFAAAAISGTVPRVVLGELAVVLALGLSYRVLGFLLLTLIPGRRSLVTAGVWLPVILALMTTRPLEGINPIAALMAVHAGAETGAIRGTLLFHGVVAAVCAAAAWMRVGRLRRRRA